MAASSSAHSSSGIGVAQRRAFSATSSAVRTPSGDRHDGRVAQRELHGDVGQLDAVPLGEVGEGVHPARAARAGRARGRTSAPARGAGG